MNNNKIDDVEVLEKVSGGADPEEEMVRPKFKLNDGVKWKKNLDYQIGFVQDIIFYIGNYSYKVFFEEKETMLELPENELILDGPNIGNRIGLNN